MHIVYLPVSNIALGGTALHKSHLHLHKCQRKLISLRASDAELGNAPLDNSINVPELSNESNPPNTALDAIPPETLRRLRREGQQSKYIIKLGRLGAGKGLRNQIHNRWRTSEVDYLQQEVIKQVFKIIYTSKTQRHFFCRLFGYIATGSMQ